MKFYMHQRIFSENLIKIGLILSAQWRFSKERYQACPVTLKEEHKQVHHNGIKSTRNGVREKYWVLQGRETVKRVLRR